ncbi:MAG: class I SAM-dependent methyltransferase [Variibacter sp.]|nr:class I SAM-dependent methyltransferase [Variibacter sp.]
MSERGHWEARYARPDYWFGTEPNAFLASQRHRLKPGWTALAVADGEGRNGVWLAEQGLDVTSVDFSPSALEKAQRLAAARGVALRTVQADLVQWSWPKAAYDLVAAIFIQFAEPPERNRVLDGIKQALKPGGLLLMQGYRPEQLAYGTGGPPKAERCYTRAFLEERFADFSSLEIREHDSVIAEGIGHAGLSALIDLVGVK